MSNKGIILLTADLVLFILIMKLVFRNFKEVKKGLFYLIKPDIVSMIQKDFHNDFSYTHKFLFVAVVMVVVVFLEVYIFY